jgi:hypothetical protein
MPGQRFDLHRGRQLMHRRSAELHRLRGVFLATLGAEETQIKASFREAIRTAQQQKSISLEKRAEATYAEYGRQKDSGLGGRGLRLPLWWLLTAPYLGSRVSVGEPENFVSKRGPEGQ